MNLIPPPPLSSAGLSMGCVDLLIDDRTFFSFFFFARVSTRTHVHAYTYTHTYTVWLRMSSGPVIDQCQTSLLLRRKRERKVDS